MKASVKRLLIVVAINEEFKAVAKHLKSKSGGSHKNFKNVLGTISEFPVEILMTSMGKKAVSDVCSQALDPTQHGGVLVIGYCGGLSLTLKIGDSVIASHVLENDAQARIPLDAALCEKLGRAHVAEGLSYRCVSMTTQERVIESPTEKHNLLKATSAEAVDMESYCIVAQAKEKGVPAAVIKIVVDDSETELPNFNEYFEKKGKMDHLGVASVFVSQPALSLQLSKYMKKANGIIAKSIGPAVEVTCAHWKIPKTK